MSTLIDERGPTAWGTLSPTAIQEQLRGETLSVLALAQDRAPLAGADFWLLWTGLAASSCAGGSVMRRRFGPAPVPRSVA